jgi:hypothetical protein
MDGFLVNRNRGQVLMTTRNGSKTSGSSVLDALRKKEAALKAAIATEKVRQQKKSEKEDARLFSIVGSALVQNATHSSDFRLMLKQILQAAEMRESDRAFLTGKGWL